MWEGCIGIYVCLVALHTHGGIQVEEETLNLWLLKALWIKFLFLVSDWKEARRVLGAN